jgi:cytoskeletal protein CcmA (bactofilin family)
MSTDTEATHGVPCIIGAGTRFEGLLSFWGTARVEGVLRGEVVAQGTLEVGPQAAVDARVEADRVVIEGTVDGEIAARERVEVLPGARVRATIRTPSLVVLDGAQFEGRLDMVRKAPEAAGAGAEAASAA